MPSLRTHQPGYCLSCINSPTSGGTISRPPHNYHRHKVASDSLYQQVCRESAHKWREAHPGYWKQYGQNHPQQVERNRRRQQRRDQKRRLLLVKPAKLLLFSTAEDSPQG